MAIQTTFTIKQVNIDQALKQAENKAKNSAEKIDKVLNQSADKGIKDVNKGVSALGENLGGLGKIAGILSSKFAIVGAGIAFIVKGIKETWDDLMLSPQEYITKQSFKLKQSSQNTAESMNQQSMENGYFARLQEIANLEFVSNSMKQEAIKLVQILTRKYGNLGIEIDAVTGQISNLDSAQTKLLQKQAKLLYKNLSMENDDISGLSTAKMKSTFARQNENNFLSRMVYDFIQQETGLVKGNVLQGISLIDSKPLEQQIKILQGFREKATREQDIKDIQEIIELKKQQLKIQEKLRSLEETGAIDDKTLTARMKEKSTKDAVASNYSLQAQQGRKQNQLEQTMQQMREQYQFSALTKTSQQLVFLQKKLSEQKEKQKNLASNISDIESRSYDDDSARLRDKKRILDIQEKIAKLEESKKQGTADQDTDLQIQHLQKLLTELQSKVYPHDKERAEDLTAISKLETEIKQSQKQQLRIQLQIAKLEQKSNRFYSDRIQSFDNQIAVQKLLLQGKFEEAERQRLINRLKQQGLKIDEKRIDTDQAKQRQLTDLNIQRQLQSDARNLYDKYAPKTKEYRTQRRIQQIEESNKVKLNDDQKKTVKQLVEFEIQLQQSKTEKANLNSQDIRTNSLTQRGGFASGVVVGDKDTVNQQIKVINEKQVSILKQIKDLIADGSKI